MTNQTAPEPNFAPSTSTISDGASAGVSAEKTLFEKIVAREIPAYIIWEDDSFLAFLTPFPSTPGLSVVVPKVNPGDDIFKIDDAVAAGLIAAVKKVALLLEKSLDVARVAMVFEGTGVAHVHAKLYPLHGDLAAQTGVWSKHVEFFEQYIGYISTVEGPRMDDTQLTEIQGKIVAAAGAQSSQNQEAKQ